MNRLKAFIRAFFGFSRTETRAFLVLIPLLLLSVFIMPAYRWWFTSQKKNYATESKKLDSLIGQWQWKEPKDSIQPIIPALFSFDPNTTPTAELIQLGFAPTLAKRIDNYRNKQGRFRIKSDLLKIYGMDTALYERLMPYITLPINQAKNFNENLPVKKEPTDIKKVTQFDVNEADTSQLIAIYGIGSKLSQRIIKYRNQLGGYVSMNQLQEVYGLDSAVIHELSQHTFISDNFEPIQISINSASEKELAAHPYITYSLAKAIATYRFQHGRFRTVEDLHKIALVDETFYTKIKPYLTLNP
ncbi:MAG: helix-hairpin-helix domain-containing protein [Cyclobacteriaceae bacterium]|jgi:competence protein ComEA|nr:helix-hairpin-helix domain-containing protein [Cyclobacteriaceae bacterium]